MNEHRTWYDEPEAPRESPTAESPAAEAPGAEGPGTRRGRHPVNVGHLVVGVALLGLTVVWAVLASDAVQLSDARWLLPLPWLLAGAVGLVASVVRGPRHHDR